MNKVKYLLSLKNTPEGRGEIRDTWKALGKIIYNTDTKIYTANTLFKVEDLDKGVLDNALVYCQNTYTVGEDFPPIEWSAATVESTENNICTVQGVMSPFFKVILLGDEVPPEEEVPSLPDDFLPFSGMKMSPDVEIDDDELIRLLTELGVPFLRLDELEYDRDTICQYMIKPALEDYYAYFPIVQEETIGHMSGGQEFDIPFPKGAHGGVLYYTLGGSGSPAGFGSGPFALYREQLMYGGGGAQGMFGNGITYRKQVPGFTGTTSGMIDARLQGMQAAQGYANVFRREKYKKVRRDGKLYATGYSTLGGNLCAKWFMHSYDWNDIEFEMLGQVRMHTKANILRNLGMLRGMIKSDLPGNIDFSVYNSRADALDEQSIRKWEASATNQKFAIMRGGL